MASIDRATCSGVRSRLTPNCSSTSADPLELLTVLLALPVVLLVLLLLLVELLTTLLALLELVSVLLELF